MPIYEYECERCGRTTEALRRMDAADDPLACEHCGDSGTRRVHSVFATASRGGPESAPPMGPCGTCGDPGGSCGLD